MNAGTFLVNYAGENDVDRSASVVFFSRYTGGTYVATGLTNSEAVSLADRLNNALAA